MMTSILRRSGLLLSTGLLTWSLSGCIAKEPDDNEGDKSSDSGKSGDDKTDGKDTEDGEDSDSDSDGKESDSDSKGSDGDSKGETEGDSKGTKPKGGSLSGAVVDASGDPVSDVTVNVCGKGAGCLNPVLTDKKGKFTVPGIPKAWKALKTAIGPGKKFDFFVGSTIEVKVEEGGSKVDVGQLTFLKIDSKNKGTSFKDVKEEKTFTAGKFKFKLDGSKFEAGFYADDPDVVENQNFAVIEVPKDIWRDEEKKIEGNKVVSVWGLFPYGGSMKDDETAALTIEDDLGIDDGTELVLFQLDADTGEVSEVGETKVKDGAIAVDKGLTKFARLYIAEKK